MSAPILLSGTIGIDTIITPTARAESILGGSACFAAAAARLFANSVDILSIIGQDFPLEWLETLKKQQINLDYVDRYNGPSFAWTGEYFENMNQRRTVSARDSVMLNWEIQVPQPLRTHPIVVASCMVPARQLQFLEQCHHPQLVLTDSMDKWIDRQPQWLDAVMERSHIVLMNEDEAMRYTKAHSLIEAGRRMLDRGPRFAIIKQGCNGAILVGRDELHKELQIFRCSAWPLEQLVDPTGAGDTFLGALAGYLANREPNLTPSFDDMKRGVVRASIAASFTCESFSADSLFHVTPAIFEKRLAAFYAMTHWD